MLIDQLNQDLKAAMLGKDAKKVSTLRFLLAALQNEKIALRTRRADTEDKPLTDEEVISVIGRQVKQRRESIESFEKGNRADLAAKEREELAILQKYLPQEMSEEEIKKAIEEAISQTGARGADDIGKVMQAVMPKVKGRADGALVNRLVREKLQ